MKRHLFFAVKVFVPIFNSLKNLIMMKNYFFVMAAVFSCNIGISQTVTSPATQAGSQTTVSSSNAQDKVSPAGVLAHCTDSYVKEHYFRDYGIKIFEQFPDYPRVKLSGNEELDYFDYKKAVDQYMMKHRDLYSLMKASENKKTVPAKN